MVYRVVLLELRKLLVDDQGIPAGQERLDVQVFRSFRACQVDQRRQDGSSQRKRKPDV